MCQYFGIPLSRAQRRFGPRGGKSCRDEGCSCPVAPAVPSAQRGGCLLVPRVLSPATLRTEARVLARPWTKLACAIESVRYGGSTSSLPATCLSSAAVAVRSANSGEATVPHRLHDGHRAHIGEMSVLKVNK